jgi:hypothetical protein
MKTGMRPWHGAGRVLLLALALSWSGCATTHKIDWNSRVGNYTFDQAVREFGPPDKSASLQDGTQIAEWLLQRGGTYGTVHAFPGFWTQNYQETRAPDYFLRLSFDADGRLSQWKRLAR